MVIRVSNNALSAITRLGIVSSANRLIPSASRRHGDVLKLFRARFYHRLCRVAVIIEFICESVFVTGPITARARSSEKKDRTFSHTTPCSWPDLGRILANGNSFLAAIIANLGANPFLGFITVGANASESRQQTPKQSGNQPAYRSSLASLCPLPLVFPSPTHLSSVREHIYIYMRTPRNKGRVSSFNATAVRPRRDYNNLGLRSVSRAG